MSVGSKVNNVLCSAKSDNDIAHLYTSFIGTGLYKWHREESYTVQELHTTTACPFNNNRSPTNERFANLGQRVRTRDEQETPRKIIVRFYELFFVMNIPL
jgi:hypothetical protein